MKNGPIVYLEKRDIAQAINLIKNPIKIGEMKKEAKLFWARHWLKLKPKQDEFILAVQYELALHNIPCYLEYKGWKPNSVVPNRIDIFLPTKNIGIELKLKKGSSSTLTKQQVKTYKKIFKCPIFVVSPQGEVGVSLYKFMKNVLKIEVLDNSESLLYNFYKSFFNFIGKKMSKDYGLYDFTKVF